MSDDRIKMADSGGFKPVRPRLDANPTATRVGDLARTEASRRDAGTLADRYGALSAARLVEAMLCQVFPGRIAVVSSFGTESAVLLDLVAQVDRATPVLFLDTGKLFAETLLYRDALAVRLGLTNIQILQPPGQSLQLSDPDGELWRTDADLCCHLRKVAPLQDALAGFDAWITGRKRFQGGERGELPTIEADGTDRLKINPLARWTPADIRRHFIDRALPKHPLEEDGYRSIGCLPCTVRVQAWEDARAGRWRHAAKTECGIHRQPVSRITAPQTEVGSFASSQA